MSLESLRLEHIPDTYRVYIGLFRSVANATHLQTQLVARNSDFEYAFIDASSVLSRLQLIGAVYKALSVFLDGTIKTPNVHSEIVCSLSPSNNISEAYRRWGITATTKDIIIVKVLFPTESRPQLPSAEEVWRHVTENVHGTPVPLTDAELLQCTDLAKVRKYYKLNGALVLEGKSEEEKTREMGLLALGAMALRGL